MFKWWIKSQFLCPVQNTSVSSFLIVIWQAQLAKSIHHCVKCLPVIPNTEQQKNETLAAFRCTKGMAPVDLSWGTMVQLLVKLQACAGWKLATP